MCHESHERFRARTNEQVLAAGGQAVPTTYHPTLRGRTTLMKRDELFVAGVRTHNADTSIPAPKVHAFYDWPDGATKLVPAALGTEDAWLQMPKAAAAGDVDEPRHGGEQGRIEGHIVKCD